MSSCAESLSKSSIDQKGEEIVDQTYVWELLQISDSAFPTGGFSHSLGLEAAAKNGHVSSLESFKTFIKSALQNTASFSLPYLSDAYHHFNDLSHITCLDQRLHAFMSNHVTKRASIRQGTSLLHTSCVAFRKVEFKLLKEKLDSETFHGHYAVVTGVVCAVLKMSLAAVQKMFMFCSLRSILSCAVRLGHIGPLEAQSLHYNLREIAETFRQEYADTPVAMATTTAPHLDIIQGTHDQLFSKLFYS
ncbi:predicted protein [Nematostella vectensis]|uniref:Urease accessory protein UreF n=1 Tax=Nematostella vectensis TaxID=45351 RepID=A7RU35_NEMVE|nr:predicted protein [Nematostella vectensis]|eukprot:XP_001637079.1 predicted protein [Nematostella vectensis]